MPKYRVYLEGRQIDIDAESHMLRTSEKGEVTSVTFHNKTSKIVGVFCRPALLGFIEVESLADQKD